MTNSNVATYPSVGSSITPEVSSKPPMERSSSASSATTNSLTDEEREKARELRKNAFKKGDRACCELLILPVYVLNSFRQRSTLPPLLGAPLLSLVPLLN